MESYFKEPLNIISIFWMIIWTLVTFKCCTTTIDFRELSLLNFSLPRCAMIGVLSCQLYGVHVDKEKQEKDVFVCCMSSPLLFSADVSSGPCFIEQRAAFPLSSGFVGLPCPGEWT